MERHVEICIKEKYEKNTIHSEITHKYSHNTIFCRIESSTNFVSSTDIHRGAQRLMGEGTERAEQLASLGRRHKDNLPVIHGSKSIMN